MQEHILKDKNIVKIAEKIVGGYSKSLFARFGQEYLLFYMFYVQHGL